MQSARLIKREEQALPPPKPANRAAQSAPVTRAAVIEWVREHQTARVFNPHKEFVALFISAQPTLADDQRAMPVPLLL